jgi:hypothetical protein
MVFDYAVYGLAISSDVTLPKLEGLESPEGIEGYPRVRLRLKPSKHRRIQARDWFHSFVTADGRTTLRQAKVAGGFLLSFPELADFFVSRDGREVACYSPYSHGSIETICHLALDQVIPCVASLVGLLALHATAVVTPRGVCGFVGTAGAGKSTLVASFDLAGYPTFCDDCLVVVESGAGMLAEPGYPGVRLWEDSAQSILGVHAKDHPALGHYTSKRGIERTAGSKISRQRTPLAAIYHLTRDASDAPQIELLAARESFVQLIRSTYRLDITDREMLAREFRALHSLIDRVPVRRLRIPSDFDALPAVREAVLADLARLAS